MFLNKGRKDQKGPRRVLGSAIPRCLQIAPVHLPVQVFLNFCNFTNLYHFWQLIPCTHQHLWKSCHAGHFSTLQRTVCYINTSCDFINVSKVTQQPPNLHGMIQSFFYSSNLPDLVVSS